MAVDIHSVVQNAGNFDDLAASDPINEEMAPTSTMAGYVESADAGHDLSAHLRACHVGTIDEFTDRQEERVAIRSALSVAEILCRPSENVCEIELRRGAETNTPCALAHAVLFDAPEMIFSERSRK